MGLAHVGPHETGVRCDGRAHQRAVQRAHARRTRHRIQRASRQKAHPLQAEERRRFRRTRLHLLQRRVHGGECARQSQGREGPEACGPVPQGGAVRRLQRHPTERRRPGSARARAELGRSRRDDLGRGGGLGARSAGIPAPRHAADGHQHLRIVPRRGPTTAGSGSRLSGA